MAKNKKNKKFKKALIMWALILLIGGEILLIYVNNVLVEYEKGNVDVYLKSLVKDIKSSAVKGNIDKYFKLENIKSDYEKDSSLKKGYQELFKEAKDVTYKKCSTCDDNNAYTLSVDAKEIANIYLDGSTLKEGLLILNYPVWEVKKIETMDKGLYDIDFYLAKDLTLTINGNKISSENIVEKSAEKGYEEVLNLENTPTLSHIKIDNLTRKPSIKVLDKNNNEVKYTYEDGKYYATTYFETNDYEEAMSKLDNFFDIQEFARLWSKFLTRDLTGSYYGYYQITPFLVENTSLWERAYNWAHSVDITFTSAHYLEKNAFTNEKLSNFKVYNNKAFSVDVYLEKNMVLTRTNSKRMDVMNDRLYIVYDNGYKVVSMMSITE